MIIQLIILKSRPVTNDNETDSKHVINWSSACTSVAEPTILGVTRWGPGGWAVISIYPNAVLVPL